MKWSGKLTFWLWFHQISSRNKKINCKIRIEWKWDTTRRVAFPRVGKEVLVYIHIQHKIQTLRYKERWTVPLKAWNENFKEINWIRFTIQWCRFQLCIFFEEWHLGASLATWAQSFLKLILHLNSQTSRNRNFRIIMTFRKTRFEREIEKWNEFKGKIISTIARKTFNYSKF